MCGFIIHMFLVNIWNLFSGMLIPATTDDTSTCNGRSIMFPGIVVQSFLMVFDVVILNGDYQQVYQ